jgi:hypothetical protein
MNPILNAFVGGWQTNGIIRIDDGRPILPLLFCQINFCNSGNIPTFGQRPDLLGPLQRAPGSPEKATNTSGGNYFANPGNLAAPANFTDGSAPRTYSRVRQPGARDVSMSLFKEFPLGRIREGMRLQFRAESFNTFNHTHFAGPDTLVGSPTFGQILSDVNNPRELQLALKLYF